MSNNTKEQDKITKTFKKNVYTQIHKDWENFKNKIVINLINFSGTYEDKEKNKKEFSSDKFQLISVKLDFKTWEEKHKALIWKDWRPYTRPDKQEIILDIDQFNELVDNFDYNYSSDIDL